MAFKMNVEEENLFAYKRRTHSKENEISMQPYIAQEYNTDIDHLTSYNLESLKFIISCQILLS